jgi:hypothetical protein
LLAQAVRLARGASLSFVSPKESKQRKCDDGVGSSQSKDADTGFGYLRCMGSPSALLLAGVAWRCRGVFKLRPRAQSEVNAQA